MDTLDGLAKDVSEITGVHLQALTKARPLSSYSIAQKMCWASQRKTTRPEDRTYSLLGILDVNISIVYGEGPRAFLRLQQELLRTTLDDSIFAFANHHNSVVQYYGLMQGSSLLANSLEAFADSHNITLPSRSTGRSGAHFQLIGQEVRSTAQAIGFRRARTRFAWSQSLTTPRTCSIILSCCVDDDPTRLVALRIKLSVMPAASTYYVDASQERIHEVDGYHVRMHLWPQLRTFNIVRDLKPRDEDQRIAQCVLMCRMDPKWALDAGNIVTGLSMTDESPSDDSQAVVQWNERTQNLIVSWKHSESNLVRLKTTFTLFNPRISCHISDAELALPGHPTFAEELELSINYDVEISSPVATILFTCGFREPYVPFYSAGPWYLSDNRRLRVSFGQGAIGLGAWARATRFESYDWTMKRHRGRYYIAKGHGLKLLLGRQENLALEICEVGFLGAVSHLLTGLFWLCVAIFGGFIWIGMGLAVLPACVAIMVTPILVPALVVWHYRQNGDLTMEQARLGYALPPAIVGALACAWLIKKLVPKVGASSTTS